MVSCTKAEITFEDNAKEIAKSHGYNYVKMIGQGGYGCVIEVEYKGKHFAMKVINKQKNEDKLNIEMVKEFRGPNLIKILGEQIKEECYYLYVMENSYIGDLSKFHKFLYKYLIFKEPFLELVGDNLIRKLTQQMVNALKTLYLGNLVHFDIKPNNMLMFENLTLKLIDFSLLKKIKTQKDNIPGGTFGYRTPESYENKEFSNNDLKKQDYYALGITIYFLKYGLIQFKPKDRLNFEQIIRNKWLNKNKKEIQKINYINQSNENNLILELEKSNFLINNIQCYRKKKFDEKYNNEKENKKYKQLKKGKFKFGKRNS